MPPFRDNKTLLCPRSQVEHRGVVLGMAQMDHKPALGQFVSEVQNDNEDPMYNDAQIEDQVMPFPQWNQNCKFDKACPVKRAGRERMRVELTSAILHSHTARDDQLSCALTRNAIKRGERMRVVLVTSTFIPLAQHAIKRKLTLINAHAPSHSTRSNEESAWELMSVTSTIMRPHTDVQTKLDSHQLSCATLVCTTLHYSTLPSSTLHCTTLHYTTILHHSTLKHNTTLNCTALPHYTSLHCTTPQHTTLHCTTLYHTAPHPVLR